MHISLSNCLSMDTFNMIVLLFEIILVCSLCRHDPYCFAVILVSIVSFFPADMANIVLLLVIIMLVFSVIGVTLFRDVVPKYFGNLSSCILLSFQHYPGVLSRR